MLVTRVIGRLSLLVFLLSHPARGAEAEASADRTLSPYFFVEGGDSGTDRLPLLGTSVRVDIAGVIAHVTVRQTYKNDGVRPLHARYVFPASTRAAVHGLRMTLGDEVVTATIRERERAKREFQAAKKAGKNAALLAQQRPNVFTMELANIVPGQRIDVELEYSELLAPTDGVYEFVYPTVVGPRYSSTPEAAAAENDVWIKSPYLHEHQPPPHALELSGTIAAGIPIHELASPTHGVRAQWRDSSRVEFALEEGERSGANRDFILRYRLEGDALQSGLLLYPGRDENFFLLMTQPPRRVDLDQVPPREYVFVIDVSGSMNGYPLATAKTLLRDLIGHLRPIDTFDVLTFAGASQLWSPRSMPASRDNVEAAIAMLDHLQAGGGTELLAAVRRAMEIPADDTPRARSIVIVTDGYIAAEREVFETIRGNLDHANVFAFGIGTGVNRYLIEGIAKAGMGEPFVVTESAEARAAAARFREYVEFPLLSGIRVAFDGFEAYDVQPSAVPDVLADRPILVQGKYRGAPRGRVMLTGLTGGGRFQRSFDVSRTRPDPANRALRELWARTRVADISDWAGAGESEARRDQIVELGLTYSLLTPYTSFVAVHDVVRNPSGAGDDVTQALPLPAGVSDAAVGGVGVGAEPGLTWTVAAALLLAAVFTWRRRAAGAGASG